jgi:hypothetical protein
MIFKGASPLEHIHQCIIDLKADPPPEPEILELVQQAIPVLENRLDCEYLIDLCCLLESSYLACPVSVDHLLRPLLARRDTSINYLTFTLSFVNANVAALVGQEAFISDLLPQFAKSPVVLFNQQIPEALELYLLFHLPS